MKILDKIGLIIFSTIVLIIALLLCVVIFGWCNIVTAAERMEEIIAEPIGSNILLVVSIILIILAIKCIFFNSYSREETKNKAGITLENDNGKLLVSRDAVENLASLVVKNFDSVENVTTKVEVDKETNMKIIIALQVHQEAIIKDLSSKLQTDVKQAIKKSLNIDVKEIIIRVRDIAMKKESTIKE